ERSTKCPCKSARVRVKMSRISCWLASMRRRRCAVRGKKQNQFLAGRDFVLFSGSRPCCASAMRAPLILIFAVFCLVSFVRAQPAPPRLFDGQSWWAHVKVLADDSMEGRETGSAGLRRAQSYVVEQLKQSGLQPAGTEGFYQHVGFVQRQIDEEKSSAALVRDGKIEPLDLGGDA